MTRDPKDTEQEKAPGEQRWENLNIAFGNFRAYIAHKGQPWSLTLIDLLHASNFKGGNASITDSEDQVNSRLKEYAAILGEIQKGFGSKGLAELSAPEKERFIRQAQQFIELPTRTETKIRGFGPSYASALLAAHLPNLAAVIDRNVLVGAKIVSVAQAKDQVQDIQSYYGTLLRFLYKKLKLAGAPRTLRELDKALFITGSRVRRMNK